MGVKVEEDASQNRKSPPAPGRKKISGLGNEKVRPGRKNGEEVLQNQQNFNQNFDRWADGSDTIGK